MLLSHEPGEAGRDDVATHVDAQADSARAGQPFRPPGERGLQVGHLAEDPLASAIQLLAIFGQSQLAGGPVLQGHAKLRLEIGDRAAH